MAQGHLIYLGYRMEYVSKLALHSSVRVTDQHCYGQIEERLLPMLSDLESHFTDQISPQDSSKFSVNLLPFGGQRKKS